MHTGDDPSHGMASIITVERRIQSERRSDARQAPRNAFFRGLGLGLILSAVLWFLLIGLVLALL